MTSPNLWYKYTATCSGEATVSLLGSNYDTKLAAYDGGECNPTSARLIECNDDFGSGYQSQITFTAVSGSQYLFEIGGYGSATGEGVLNVSCAGQQIHMRQRQILGQTVRLFRDRIADPSQRHLKALD